MREQALASKPHQSHHKALRSPILAQQILSLSRKALIIPCLLLGKWAEMGNGNEGIVCPSPLHFLPRCIKCCCMFPLLGSVPE